MDSPKKTLAAHTQYWSYANVPGATLALSTRTHSKAWSAYLRSLGYPKELMHPGTQTAVCGGIWRSHYMRESPSDIDVFCMSEDARQLCHELLARDRHRIHTSKRATLFAGLCNIHLVRKIYGPTLVEILSSFDFDICMFGTDFSRDCCPSRAANSLNSIENKVHWGFGKDTKQSVFKALFRTYRVNRRTSALTSVPHAMRLYAKGFHLSPANFVDLVERAGLEISLLRASGSDPAKVMGSCY